MTSSLQQEKEGQALGWQWNDHRLFCRCPSRCKELRRRIVSLRLHWYMKPSVASSTLVIGTRVSSIFKGLTISGMSFARAFLGTLLGWVYTLLWSIWWTIADAISYCTDLTKGYYHGSSKLRLLPDCAGRRAIVGNSFWSHCKKLLADLKVYNMRRKRRQRGGYGTTTDCFAGVFLDGRRCVVVLSACGSMYTRLRLQLKGYVFIPCL